LEALLKRQSTGLAKVRPRVQTPVPQKKKKKKSKGQGGEPQKTTTAKNSRFSSTSKVTHSFLVSSYTYQKSYNQSLHIENVTEMTETKWV
jgi:hypothetical protein